MKKDDSEETTVGALHETITDLALEELGRSRTVSHYSLTSRGRKGLERLGCLVGSLTNFTLRTWCGSG